MEELKNSLDGERALNGSTPCKVANISPIKVISVRAT